MLRRVLLLSTLALTTAACSADSGANGRGGDGDGSRDGDGDGEVLPGGTATASLLPARIRRLTNAEYNASVQSLLRTTQSPADDFPPDRRQHGYTTNEAQRVDPVLARQLDSAGISLADEVLTRLDEFAPCADPVAGGRACAESFVNYLAPRAYRRLLTEEERAALLGLYEKGSEGADYAAGIHLIIRGVFQSPNFLYLTEIGDGSETGVIQLTAFEMASAMAYLLTSGPPDETLLVAAEVGELSTPEARMTHARRLLESESGKAGVVRFVREWLGVDRISVTGKDLNVYPEYEGLQAHMHEETAAFVGESLTSSGANVEELLGAPWTVASPELAAFYGATGSGKVDVPERPGLLNRAAFLSVYAHAHETAPVLRGTAVLRRINCLEIELPTTLDVEIVPPVPDETKTTRDRFAIHAEDDACRTCHNFIDPLGFSFEHLDGMGAPRTMENNQAIDSSSTVAIGGDFDGPYASSKELAASLATSEAVRTCFARQLFRATTAEGEGAPASEEEFLTAWGALPESDQKSLVETLVALMGSELIAYRSEP